jgi:hypothetical protein
MRKVCFNVIYNFSGLSEEEFEKIRWEGEKPVFSPDMGRCLTFLTCTIENTRTGKIAHVEEMSIDGRGTRSELVHEFYSAAQFFDSNGTPHERVYGYSEFQEEISESDESDECVDWCDVSEFFPHFSECVQDAFDIALGWVSNKEEGND